MRRTLGCLVAGSILLLTQLPVITPAHADDALTPVTSIALPRMYADTSLIAASGDTVIRQVAVDSQQVAYEYSRDNGKTWKRLPAALSGLRMAGYKEIFYGLELTDYVPADEGCSVAKVGGFTIWNSVTGATRTVAVTPEQGAVESECPRIEDAVADRVVLNDGRVFDLSAATARQLTVTFGANAPSDIRARAISADGRTVLGQGSVWDAKQERVRDYLAVAPTDGAKGPPAFELAGLRGTAVAAGRLHYLVATKTGLRVCRAVLTAPTKPTCVTLRKGDSRSLDVVLDVSQGVDLVTSWTGDDRNHLWISKGTTVRKLMANSTVGRVQGTGFRDPSRPLVQGIHSGKGVVFGRLSTSLKADWAIIGRKVPTRVTSLALVPNRVLAIDSRPFLEASPTPLWYRTFSGAKVGDEVRLAGPVGASWRAFASGARSVADCCTSLKTKFYDGAKRVFNQRLKDNVLGVSGPYVATYDRIRRSDGKSYASAFDPVIFGSLVATLNPDNRKLTIRDLTRPSATPITRTLPAGPEYWAGGIRIWGDWISVSTGSEDEGYSSQVVNYRTGQTYTIDGDVRALGDGYALVFRFGPMGPGDDDYPRSVELWNYQTGEHHPVPVASRFEVAIDGVNQVAWVTEKTIEVAKVPGAGTSKPRLLGAVAASSFRAGKTWKLALDVTKPLRPGTVEIRKASGALVRSLPTKATASGSLRGLGWDGRDAKGRKVAAGSYAWILKASAADGTGIASDVTGLRQAAGTVKVTR